MSEYEKLARTFIKPGCSSAVQAEATIEKAEVMRLTAQFRLVAATERTKIVAWLRARNETVNTKNNFADAIERGEHES